METKRSNPQTPIISHFLATCLISQKRSIFTSNALLFYLHFLIILYYKNFFTATCHSSHLIRLAAILSPCNGLFSYTLPSPYKAPSGSPRAGGEYYGILPLLSAGLGFFGGFPYRNQNTAETTACGGGGGLLVLSTQQRTRAIIAALVRCSVLCSQ